MKRETMTGYNDLVKSFQVPSEDHERNNYQKLPENVIDLIEEILG